ncbi:hypothetical protein, partial [Burkholderia sp. SIMBA_024]
YKAATAWFHGKGSREHATVEASITAALEFAGADLALAMLKGNAIEKDELAATAAQLSAMIGIPAQELIDSRLWISKQDFRARLLS